MFKNQKVRKGKVSKAPLLILLLLSLIILTAAFFAVQQRQAGNSDSAEADFTPYGKAAEQIARLRQAASAAPHKAKEDSGEDREEVQAEPVSFTRQDFLTDFARYEDMRLQPTVQASPPPAPEPAQEDPQANLRAQREAAFQSALRSGSKVSLSLPGGNSSVQTQTGNSALTPSQQQELRRIRQEIAAAGGSASGSSSADSHTLSGYSTLRRSDGFSSPERPVPADTPFLLRQGTVVPAVLLTGINSDVPGQVMAQTTGDVLDTALGNHVLIPRGSRLLGQYMALPAYGTRRLMIGFNRLLFPDGSSMGLDVMPGTSTDGYAGFDAEVDNHMFRLLTNALLLGGITMAVSLSQDNVYDSEGNLTTGGAMSQALGLSLGQVLTQVVERNLNIAPTLTLQPGYEFNLTLIKDLRFDGPYRS